MKTIPSDPLRELLSGSLQDVVTQFNEKAADKNYELKNIRFEIVLCNPKDPEPYAIIADLCPIVHKPKQYIVLIYGNGATLSEATHNFTSSLSQHILAVLEIKSET